MHIDHNYINEFISKYKHLNKPLDKHNKITVVILTIVRNSISQP